MIKYTFEILFIFHLLGDFYFQTEKMALEKSEKYVGVVKHFIIYAICFSLCTYIVFPGFSIKLILFPGIAHAFIDSVKYVVCKKVNEGKIIFFIDQLLHVISIFVVVYCVWALNIQGAYRMELLNFLSNLNMKESNIISWLVKLILIHKPANIMIGKILAEYKVQDERTVNDKKAGRLIGTLERILMVIFVSIEQYSAVGLVLTAKSIARYEKISKNKEFAEYYLLGTLLSTIIAIVTAIIF